MKGIVNVPAGGGMIATHNADPKAHPDIREALKAVENQPSELEQMVSDHNEDKSAHEDIREKLATVAEQQSQDKKQLEELAQAQSQAAVVYRTVTLTVEGWQERVQTVSVTGVSAKETDQLIIPTPALANQEAYLDAGILATAQEANSLTFTAVIVPEEELTVYVTIVPFGGGTA